MQIVIYATGFALSLCLVGEILYGIFQEVVAQNPRITVVAASVYNFINPVIHGIAMSCVVVNRFEFMLNTDRVVLISVKIIDAHWKHFRISIPTKKYNN